MLELASPIVRVGRVVSFRDALDKPQAPFDHERSAAFADQLQENARQLSAFLATSLPGATITSPADATARRFVGRQIIVRMRDFSIVTADGDEFRLGLSTTVCKGERHSKVWCRISSDSTVPLEASEIQARYDVMVDLAERGSDALASYYGEQYELFAGAQAPLRLRVEHRFILEAGSYSSDRLIDVVSALRETSNLHDVVESNAWHPMYQVLRFADMRLGPELGLAPLSRYEKPSEADVTALSEILNEDGRGVTWEVAQGRHGVFAQTEDDNTTHLVGLCARHSPFTSRNDRPDAWIISGQVADQLGSGASN